jgi:TolA-binding protein
VKAVQIVPDSGLYWTMLGSMRARLANKSGAKDAYQSGLKAYQAEAATDAGQKEPDPWLKQIQVLALLGRVDEARAMVDKVAKRFPDNRAVRGFVEGKYLDKMLVDPMFKQGAI